MKGDWEDDGLGDFLSLGSSSRITGSRSVRSGEREGFSGRAGISSRDESLEPNLAMLSSLSRDGLSMLAGGARGGFTLRPPPVGNLSEMPSLGSLAVGDATSGNVTGGGLTGFYGASVPKTTWPSSPAGMGLRFVNEEAQVRDEAGAPSSHREGSDTVGKPEQPLRTDVENMTPEECWRLVLNLGKRWPAWNRTTGSQSPQGVRTDRSSILEGLDLAHYPHKDGRPGGNSEILQLGQDPLKLLTTRALEALAQTPDRYGRPAGSMLAPKPTTQKLSNTKAARNLPGPSSQSGHSTLAVPRQPTLSAKPPTSPPRLMAAPTTSSAGPRTAPLTIFYDGIVNVCDNVPEDKARFIMLIAERSNIKLTAQAPAPSASCAAQSTSASPSTIASPQVNPGSFQAPQEIARPQEASDGFVVTATSSVPSHVALPRNHPEGSSSHKKPIESSIPAQVANAAPPSTPFKAPTTEGSSRQLLQQSLNGSMSKRLPNARKNSLARFLDSRKRNRPTASSSEDQPSKKQELGPHSDGLPSDADDTKGSGKSPMPLRSHSSIESRGEYCHVH